MNNIRRLPNSTLTVEDAKRVQRLVEHLRALRNHRDVLAYKRAYANLIRFHIPITEAELPANFPPEARRRHDSSYVNGRNYSHDAADGWHLDYSLTHGRLDDSRFGGQGYLPTLGLRVMDGVRAAILDEIEVTERAIIDLGFALPVDDGTGA